MKTKEPKAIITFDFMSPHEAVQHARNNYRSYGQRPTRPRLNDKHTAEDIRAYGEAFRKYEVELDNHENTVKQVQAYNAAINDELEKFLKEESGLNSSVPEKYRDKVWSLAWSDGHSNGYGEVYEYLRKYVEIFE